jgi:hypothetical protein
LDARRAAGYRSYVAASSVRLPLEYLIGIGVAPLLNISTAPSPVDCLLEKYRRYLLLERRLAETTIAGYECVARVFLKHRVRRCGGLELERLSAADVSEFVSFECQRLTDGAARGQAATVKGAFLVPRPQQCVGAALHRRAALHAEGTQTRCTNKAIEVAGSGSNRPCLLSLRSTAAPASPAWTAAAATQNGQRGAGCWVCPMGAVSRRPARLWLGHGWSHP